MRAVTGQWAARALSLALAAVSGLAAAGPVQAASISLREICASPLLSSVTLTAVVDLPLDLRSPPTVGMPVKGGNGTVVLTIPRGLGDEIRRFDDPTLRVTGTVFAQVKEGTTADGPLVQEMGWRASGSGTVSDAGGFNVPLKLTTKDTFTPRTSGRHSLQAGTFVLTLANGGFETPIEIVCVADPSQDPLVRTFDVRASPSAGPAVPTPPLDAEPTPVAPSADPPPTSPSASPPTVVQTDVGMPLALVEPLRFGSPPSARQAARPAPTGVTVRSRSDEVLVDAPLMAWLPDAEEIWSPPAGQVQWYAAAGWVVPGSPGTAVLAGHVGSTLDGPDVFARLPEVAVGDAIILTNAAGLSQRYVVTRSEAMSKSEVPADASIWGASPTPQLRLITCDPASALVDGHFTGNWVVWARPF